MVKNVLCIKFETKNNFKLLSFFFLVRPNIILRNFSCYKRKNSFKDYLKTIYQLSIRPRENTIYMHRPCIFRFFGMQNFTFKLQFY